MTASWSLDEQPAGGDPLRPGASPSAIREALLPEDRPGFDAASADALGAARESLELTELSGAWSGGGGWRCRSGTRPGSRRWRGGPQSG